MDRKVGKSEKRKKEVGLRTNRKIENI
jgi:hypothetical protein